MKPGRCGAAWLGAVCFAIATRPAHCEIHIDHFNSTDALSLVGDAGIAGSVLRLTPARRNQTGAAWFRQKQVVRSGFETTFQFQLTHQDWILHGSDGFAFVIQDSGPKAIGGRGSAAGFGMPDPTNPRHPGIPRMIAVFFDTLRNPQEGDPSSNFVAIRASGESAVTQWPTTRLAMSPSLHVRLKDRKAHTARIAFDPPVLSVFLDDSLAPVLKTVVDLSFAIDHEGKAWVGFTAATGWGFQNHDILNWSFGQSSVSSNMAAVSSDITFPMSACLPNRNLCTPERPFVERKGGGYHVVLPADLEWGASIPNPSGRSVVVMNAKGIVCWDVKAPSSQGCGGPSGNGSVAGAGISGEKRTSRCLDHEHPRRSYMVVCKRSYGCSFQEKRRLLRV